MIKILGGILILLSSGMFGQYLSSKEKYALHDLYSFKKSFMSLQSEIKYLKTPLPEAFEKISKNAGLGINKFFQDFSYDLVNSNLLDINLIWRNNFDKNKSKLYLNYDIQEHIKEFGIALDKQDWELIIKNIDMILIQIDNEIQQGIEKNEKTKKLYKQLSILFGCLLIVLFI